MPRLAKGFSLIELMVTIAVAAIMLALAVPNFREWINNSRIRSAAESIQNGLRVARNEAAQRGSPTRFELTSASAATWTVCQLPTGTTTCTAAKAANAANVIEQRDATESLVTLTGSTSSAMQDKTKTGTVLTGGVPGGVTFNALARPQGFNTTALARIDVAGKVTAGRRLVVLIYAGGQVRACDPDTTNLASTDAQSCQTN